jgi:predicted secreted hydrolase
VRLAGRVTSRLPLLLLLAAIAATGGVAIWMGQGNQATHPGSKLTLEAISGDGNAGFVKAAEPWSFRFPADHGGHPDFRTEVWQVTGNLEDEAGQSFGFQLAFFCLRLRPSAAERTSAWVTNQVFRGHFALADVASGRFHAEERFSRVALGLSGTDKYPFRVWLEDWSLETVEAGDGTRFRLRADDGERALSLELRATKPPLLEDAADLPGSISGGGAFHFYLISRLSVTGSLRLGGAAREVRGWAWLDRAWGALPISQGQIAWSRFALQLEDGRDLLCLQLRRRDGGGKPIPSCLLIGAEGSTRSFRRREIRLEPLAHWHSRLDGTGYPVRWRLELPDEQLEIEIRALLDGQELELATPVWSGVVEVSGRSGNRSASGWGHLELRGYTDI